MHPHRSTRRLIARVLLSCLFFAVALARSARAEACDFDPIDLFEKADQAAHVAIVSVTAAPAKTSGPVSLKVERMLKGPPAATLSSRDEPESSCAIGFAGHRRALVFLDAAGDPIGFFEGVIELRGSTSDPAGWVAAYLVAHDDDARAAVLVAAALAGSNAADDAARHLTDRADLLVRISGDARARLVRALPRARAEDGLVDLLGRLGEAKARRLLRRREYDQVGSALGRACFEGVSDRELLAREIERGDDARRAGALDRCERLLGVTLARFYSYVQGVSGPDWRELAGRCRRGR